LKTPLKRENLSADELKHGGGRQRQTDEYPIINDHLAGKLHQLLSEENLFDHLLGNEWLGNPGRGKIMRRK